MKNLITGLAVAAVLVPSVAFASVDITLDGGSVTVLRGQSYNEPGYSALSSFDGDITNQVSVSGVDTSQVGDFSIDYSVTDSNLDSAFASRSVTVRGTGGSMTFCSGPDAPGWNVSLPGGGCGSTSNFVQFNQPVGDGTLCPFMSGCMVPQKFVIETPAQATTTITSRVFLIK